jgi:hypothetical protein
MCDYSSFRLPRLMLWNELVARILRIFLKTGSQIPEWLFVLKHEFGTAKIYVPLRLFKDAVSSSDYVASNDGMISEQWIGKDMEGSRLVMTQSTMPAFSWRDQGKPQQLQSGLTASVSRFEPWIPRIQRSAGYSAATFDVWLVRFIESSIYASIIS